MDKILYNNYINILKEELIPALGCTEPIAIAFAGAKIREIIGNIPEHITVKCSGNIIKNVKGVTVPNSGGLKGIDTAAILGLVGGDASKNLEVLSTVKQEDIEKTKELLNNKKFCSCELIEGDEIYHLVSILYCCIIVLLQKAYHSSYVPIFLQWKILHFHSYIRPCLLYGTKGL